MGIFPLLQGPLRNTCGHFWLMIWEQRSKAVIMLNRVIEKGLVGEQIILHFFYFLHSFMFCSYFLVCETFGSNAFVFFLWLFLKT